MVNINVDFNKITGAIKPMHAINNGPMDGATDTLWHTVAEAGIPYSRLHDTGGTYGGAVYVDIPNIFRDFFADVNDPLSYDFAFTDHLLKRLNTLGVQPFYRLGVTIENNHAIKPYNIYPPIDQEKWAKICEHIILHYNCGWANGFNYNIKYWEIWNEPDNEILPENNPMWRGTKEQYFKLYEVASNHLKKCFPNIEIGGYSSCGFYEIINAIPDKSAKISTRTEYFVGFFHEFLGYISSEEHKSPLDFFSWHSYSGSADNLAYADFARKTLDSYGFTHTKSILNEWNTGICNRGKLRDASDILGMMIDMQNSSVDMLMYYDGQVKSRYCGLYNPLDFTVFKAYYAFKYFNTAYCLKNQVYAVSDCDLLKCMAAVSGNEYVVILANNSDTPQNVAINFSGCNVSEAVYFVTDTKNDNAVSTIKCKNSMVVTLESRAIGVIKL